MFGAEYDKERFDKGEDGISRVIVRSSADIKCWCIVIYQTGLERDLILFDAGDMTEVGEKGITLR